MIVNKKAFDKEAKIRGEMVDFERQLILKIIDDRLYDLREHSSGTLDDFEDKEYTIEELKEIRNEIKHLGSDLCPQTVQRGAEGLPDGCAEKPRGCTEGDKSPSSEDKKFGCIHCAKGYDKLEDVRECCICPHCEGSGWKL